MGSYRTQIVKREVTVSRIESVLENLKAYGKKCRNFYEFTMST